MSELKKNRIKSPEQLNKIAAGNISNTLTKPPDPFKFLIKKKPEYAWHIDMMEKGIGIIRDLTPEERQRVVRWIMLWEKTYWMWVNDSIPAMSPQELEEWKNKAKNKLQQLSKMWTAFADVLSSEEAKQSVEELSDAIVKFGAAITYVTTMFAGKMMVKYKPEVKIALDSAILIFKQSIADLAVGAGSAAVGPLATAPKLLFNAIEGLSKGMQFTAVAIEGLSEAGFLAALSIDQGMGPLLELMKSGEEAVSTLKKIANDASNILDEKPPRKEVRDAVTNMELSTMPKSQRGFQPPQPVGELKQPVGELKQPVGTKPEGPGDTLVAVEEEEEE